MKFKNQLNKLYHILFSNAIEEKIFLDIFVRISTSTIDKRMHKWYNTDVKKKYAEAYPKEE